MQLPSAIASLFGPGEKGKAVIFQSRFRNFRILLGLKDTGERNRAGERISTPMQAEFNNGLFVVKDTPENAPLIAAMRKHAGTDFQEVDLEKQSKEESEKDKKIEDLEKQLNALKASKMPEVRPRMRKTAKP